MLMIYWNPSGKMIKKITIFLLFCITTLGYAQKYDEDMTPLERANDYWLDGKYRKAIKLLQKIVKRNPVHYKAYLLMASVYSNMKDEPKEEESLKKSIIAAPHQPNVYERYGDFLEGKERPIEARQVYRQGVEKNPGYDYLYYRLGGVLKEMKEYKQALEVFNKAIALNNQRPVYFFLRAGVHDHLKNYPKALADFDQTIALEPKDASNYDSRALLKFELKDYMGALADYEKAEALDSVKYKGAAHNCKEYIAGAYAYKADDLDSAGEYVKSLYYAKEALKWPVTKEIRSWMNSLIPGLERKISKQRFWAPFEASYQKAVELRQAKKYKEALVILDKDLKILTEKLKVLRPLYKKMYALRTECKEALAKENKD